MLANAITTTHRRQGEEAQRLIQLSREELDNQNYSEALILLVEARSMAGADSDLVREINTVTQQIDIQNENRQIDDPAPPYFYPEHPVPLRPAPH